MNSGATSERVYDALKRLICDGRYRPGERLEAEAIGEHLTSSITPVRDALYRLVGEGLVVTRTSSGFHVPPIDAPGLEDLYRWNADVVAFAARSGVGPITSIAMQELASERAAAALFAALAARSTNIEHARAIASLNDRLAAPRAVEGSVVEMVDAEMNGLSSVVASGDLSETRKALLRYHRRRIRHAADIVRALYRERAATRTIGK